MSSQRRAGVVLGYANIIVKNLVNLVYTPMLLSFVGQADYGVYQSCYSFVFSLTLLSLGFSQAYVRFYTQRKISGSEEGVRRLNGVYLVLYLIVSAVALALGLVFAASARAIFSNGFTEGQIAVAGTAMFFMAINIAVTLLNSAFDAFVLAREEFRFQQSRQLLTTLATPFVAYGLLCLGMGVVGVAVAQMTVSIALLALNISFCVGRLRMRFDVRHFDGALFRAIAVFSTWLFANQVCELVNQNVPNTLLGAISGAVAVSVFAVAVQVRSVFYSLSTTMSNVFIPLVNRIVAETDDNAELTRLMARVGRYQAMLYVWVYGGFVLLGRFFIARWAGEGFSDAYWLVLVMTAPLFIPLVQNTGIEIQRAKNRHKARSACYLVMAALNLAITVVLAPLLGYWAPAVGYVTYVVLGTGAFMNWYYQSRVGLDMAFFWRSVVPTVVAGVLVTALCLFGTRFLPVINWITFAMWGVAYSVLYVLLTVVVVLTGEERDAIARRLHSLQESFGGRD